jgi:hypothetical protein
MEYCNTQKFPAKFCLFAGDACQEHIDEAKNYVKRMGLTSEDVKIICNDENVLIITKREVEIKDCLTICDTLG